MSDPPVFRSNPAPLWRRALRLTLRLGLIAALAFGLHLMSVWVHDLTGQLNSIDHARTMTGILAVSLLGYALLLAAPFVPGVEIGVAILLVEGPSAAPFVYAATILGLALAYLVGRFLPLPWLARILADLRLATWAAAILRLDAMPREDRIARLCERMPKRLGKIAVNYRYIMLAVLVNLPGTAVIGGGGGILTLAGLSRLFNFWGVLATIMIACAPVPLAVWLFGTGFLH
ncbi:MAG: hypothetical protein GC146_06740 [Limimaricola sp.]|uniref:hypothetical protein n=1 Tax=Limimaricola sp. TaxID=2211665 RepID=UPI001E1026B6|nr:hypothetical protein [Limimaricola sp.]MBI1416902.1 hypothetical protein [Limimaricola sp.]